MYLLDGEKKSVVVAVAIRRRGFVYMKTWELSIGQTDQTKLKQGKRKRRRRREGKRKEEKEKYTELKKLGNVYTSYYRSFLLGRSTSYLLVPPSNRKKVTFKAT